SSLIIRLAYAIYCKQHFQECHFFLVFDKNLLKEMFAFSGWTFIGSTSSILRDQGVNIVINIFCGTAVNAARGIAMQVYNAIHGFSQNFILAVNPQIIKSYACGDIDYMFSLSFRSSRFSYYLLFCISLPLIIQMNWLLTFWLEIVPEFTLQFSIWVLIFGMTEAISMPLQYVNQASGKVKVYQLVIGGIQMLNFPLSSLLLWLNFSPVSVFVLAVFISLICLFARLLILHKELELPIFTFCKDVLLKIIIVSIFGTIIPLTILYFWNPTLVLSRITLMLIAFASACFSSYYLGCQKSERDFISRKIESALNRLTHNA
ncbi:MAG: lipopolysaccharide biosynthesis protein, partial [Muribaculaceae bacterium]|nr:lipopolysaccharide biosynthesis protein [Muribaculaceae bacterium]